jgi:four helix bundle protein
LFLEVNLIVKTKLTAMHKAQELLKRTQDFALRIMKLYEALPKKEVARVLGRQVLRSGTSIGANYRAVCNSRLKREFFAKLSIVVEEADETIYWLELLVKGGIVPEKRMTEIMDEATQLVKILSASRRTARRRGGSKN